jgi:chromosome segregation ATPase
MANIQELVKKRDELENRKSRLCGKLEAAKTSLADIDSKIEGLGIDPDNLEAEIARLKAECESALNTYIASLEEAENIISTIEDRIQTI